MSYVKYIKTELVFKMESKHPLDTVAKEAVTPYLQDIIRSFGVKQEPSITVSIGSPDPFKVNLLKPTPIPFAERDVEGRVSITPDAKILLDLWKTEMTEQASMDSRQIGEQAPISPLREMVVVTKDRHSQDMIRLTLTRFASNAFEHSETLRMHKSTLLEVEAQLQQFWKGNTEWITRNED